MNVKQKDLTGQRFGKLTVIRSAEDRIYPDGSRRPQWKCKCDCGNIYITEQRYLSGGRALSCGKCITSSYDLSGECGIGYTASGVRFLFDKEDYDKIKDYSWYCDIYRSNYVRCRDKNHNHLRLHRLVLGVENTDCRVVDHINHNTLDNRKSNLRLCDKNDNNRNRKIPITNSSGTAGVYWDNKNNKWKAEIREHGKYHSLGRFDNIDDAIAARKKAEEQYFGEFAPKDSD